MPSPTEREGSGGLPAVPPAADAPLLALDTGSPVNSVAVAVGARVLALRTVPIGRSSARLLALVDEVLAEADLGPASLGGVLAVRGPGSFTGLRVGLASALGLCQSLGVPAAAVPTFDALAIQAAGSDRPIVAAVDALRGEWFVQEFSGGDPPRPAAPPARVPAAALAARAPATVVGFNLAALAGLAAADAGPELRLVEAGPLAPQALALAARGAVTWDPRLLTAPLYLREPAARPAGR